MGILEIDNLPTRAFDPSGKPWREERADAGPISDLTEGGTIAGVLDPSTLEVRRPIGSESRKRNGRTGGTGCRNESSLERQPAYRLSCMNRKGFNGWFRRRTS